SITVSLPLTWASRPGVSIAMHEVGSVNRGVNLYECHSDISDGASQWHGLVSAPFTGFVAVESSGCTMAAQQIEIEAGAIRNSVITDLSKYGLISILEAGRA